MLFEKLTGEVIDATMKVHSALGSALGSALSAGLFEEVYKVCLRHELTKKGLKALSEVGLPVSYDGVQLEVGYRIDLLV